MFVLLLPTQSLLNQTRRVLGRAHVPPTKFFRWLAMTKNIVKPCVAAAVGRKTIRLCRWDFPDVIKFCIAVHMVSEKAIRFRYPDYNPDGAQKLISSSMSHICRHATFHQNPCIHFWVICSQTDKQTNEHGQKHIAPHLSEVNKASLYWLTVNTDWSWLAVQSADTPLSWLVVPEGSRVNTWWSRTDSADYMQLFLVIHNQYRH